MTPAPRVKPDTDWTYVACCIGAAIVLVVMALWLVFG